MASFGVFDSLFITKTSQEWGRTWNSPWQSKIEAKLHEQSKFWWASKPFPNQSSMQGRESKKQSNIQEFRNPFAKYSQACELPKKEFRKPCWIFVTLRNLPVISKYFCTDPLDFYLKIFCVITYSLLVIYLLYLWILEDILGDHLYIFSKKYTELCSTLPTHFVFIFFLAK